MRVKILITHDTFTAGQTPLLTADFAKKMIAEGNAEAYDVPADNAVEIPLEKIKTFVKKKSKKLTPKPQSSQSTID